MSLAPNKVPGQSDDFNFLGGKGGAAGTLTGAYYAAMGENQGDSAYKEII